MTKKRRTVLAILLIEIILASIWVYLARTGKADPSRVSPDFQSTLGSTMGMAMGAFLGFGLLLFFIAAKRDREG